MNVDLIINKNDANYGETAAGAAITDINAVGTLAEGAWMAAFPNGVIINRDGAVADLSAIADQNEVVIYAMENSQVRSLTIPIAGAKRTPKFTNSAATKVVTMTLTLPTSHDDVKHSGVLVIDADKHPNDPAARKRYEVVVDGDSVSTGSSVDAVSEAVATLLATHPKIATAAAVEATGVVTITCVAGANLNFKGTGYFENKTVTVSTALEFANTLSAAELIELEKQAQIKEGRSQDALFGGDVANMFTKVSMVESGETYTIRGISYPSNLQSNLKDTAPNQNLLLIASCNANPADDVGDTGDWDDLIAAIVGGVTEIP